MEADYRYPSLLESWVQRFNRKLLLEDDEVERGFELNQLRNRKSVISVILYFVTPLYLISVYWANIIRSIDDRPSIYALSLVCVILFIVVSGSAVYCQFMFDDETVVYSHFIRRLIGLAAAVKILNYGVLFYLQGFYDLCHPTYMFNGVCSRDEYPTDMLLCLLFTTAITQIGFPSLSWGYAISAHFAAVIIAAVCTPLYSSSLKIPLIIWSSTCVTGSIMIRRRDAMSNYLLSRNSEMEKELEQQAKLGDRLRLMISGVAHDLKSPLSALSLGLESIYAIHDQVRTIIYDIPSRIDQQTKAQDLLATIKDLGQWLDTSRRSMNTIISRFVDVNQALNGIPLMPMIRNIEIVPTIESVIRNYSDDNQHVLIIPRIDEDVDEFNGGAIDTDSLWVRESLGCLISNAIKFCDYSEVEHLHEGHKQHIQVIVSRMVEKPHSTSWSISEWGRQSRSRRGIYTQKAHCDKEEEPPSLNECWLRIEVWDEGTGVDKEMQKSLFSFLGHVNQVRVGGAGLGLGALACRIRTLGGRYGYEPRILRDAQRGSIFWFEVPYKPFVFVRNEVNEGDGDEVKGDSYHSKATLDKPSPHSPMSQGSHVVTPHGYAHLHASSKDKDSARDSPASSRKSRKAIHSQMELKRGNSGNSIGRFSRANSGNIPSVHGPEAVVVRMDSAVDRLTEEVRLQLMGEDVGGGANALRSVKHGTSTTHNTFRGNKSVHHSNTGGGNDAASERSGRLSMHRSVAFPSPRVTGSRANTPSNISPASASGLSTSSPMDQRRDSSVSLKPSGGAGMHANAHHHHPHHRFQSGHHLSKLSSARVIPVDDEYAPHERMMDRNLSLNSLSSIKETSSGDQHSVKSGHTASSGKRYGLLTPQSLLANGNSNVNGVLNSSPLAKASPIIANMPMVAESEPPSPIAGVNGGGARNSFSALRSPLTSAPPLSPLTAASTPAAANTPMMMLMKPIAEQPRDTASVNGNNLFIAPKRILIVDDSMPIRKMCAMILKQHGHSVVTAMNGKEALQMMIQACDARVAAASSSSPAGTVPASEAIDLVLMDIQMPVMDGLEAVTLYRAHEAPLMEKLQQAVLASPASSAVLMKPLLIIGMSACSDVDIIEKGLSIGMDRFVAKPFQIHHLTPIIHDYFDDGESS